MKDHGSIRKSQLELANAIRRIDTILHEVHEQRGKKTDVNAINMKIKELKKDLMETERTVKLLLIELKKEKKQQEVYNLQLKKTLSRVKAYETETRVFVNLQNDIALIDNNDFAELRRLMHPVKALRDLFTAIAILFKVPKHEEWSNVQKFIASASTKSKILSLKPEDVDRNTFKKVKKYINEHEDTINRLCAYQANKKVAPLEPWLRLIVSLYEKRVIEGVNPDNVNEKLAVMRRNSVLHQNNVHSLALTVARAEAAELEVVNAIKVLIHEKKTAQNKTGIDECRMSKPQSNVTSPTPTRSDNEDLSVDDIVNLIDTSLEDNLQEETRSKDDDFIFASALSKLADNVQVDDLESAINSNQNVEKKDDAGEMKNFDGDDYCTREEVDDDQDSFIGRLNLDDRWSEHDIAKLADEINLHADEIDIDVDDLQLSMKPRLSQQATTDFEDSILRWNCYKRQSIRYKTDVFSLWQSKGAIFKRSSKKPKDKRQKSDVGYDVIRSDSSAAAPWLGLVEEMRGRRSGNLEMLSPRTWRSMSEMKRLETDHSVLNQPRSLSCVDFTIDEEDR